MSERRVYAALVTRLTMLVRQAQYWGINLETATDAELENMVDNYWKGQSIGAVGFGPKTLELLRSLQKHGWKLTPSSPAVTATTENHPSEK